MLTGVRELKVLLLVTSFFSFRASVMHTGI